jgi:hypothetical protein
MEETKSEATECGTHKRECIAYLTLDEGYYESLNAQCWRKREEQGNEVPDNKFEGLKMSRQTAECDRHSAVFDLDFT